MLLLHRHTFSVASYHQRVDSQQATEDLAQGLVVPVELGFESWLGGRPIQAEAFLDPGADNSMISLRWIHETANEAGAPADAGTAGRPPSPSAGAETTTTCGSTPPIRRG